MCSSIALATTFEDIQVINRQVQPTGHLANRGDGYFYGVSRYSENNPYGMIYRFAPDKNLEVLYSFPDIDYATSTNFGGQNPASALTAGPNGEFYGTTSYGGAHGMGTIYRLSADGVFSVIHDIHPADGYDCWRLILDPAGDILGVMGDGGPGGAGTIFRLSPDGTYQTVHAFQRPAFYPPWMVPPGASFEPFYPNSIALAPDGSIYGTTSGGGPIEAFGWSQFTYGTFFQIQNTGEFTILGEFDPFKKRPESMTPATGGFFVTTEGKIFHVSYNGTISVEMDFTTMPETGVTSLGEPVATAQGSYGVSMYGGNNGGGFIYRLLPEGGFSVAHHFPTNFERCQPTLAEGNDGLIYGLIDFGATDPSLSPRVFRLHDAATSPNYVPVAAPDEAWLPRKATNGKREVIVDILGNDHDPDSDPLTITSFSGDVGSGTAELIQTPQGVKLKFSTQEDAPSSRLLTYTVADSQGSISKSYVAIKSPAPGYYSGYASGGEVLNAPLGLSVSKTNFVVATFDLNGVKYSGQGTLDTSDTANFSLSATGQAQLGLRVKLQRGTNTCLEATIRHHEAIYQGTCTAPGGN